MDRAILGSCVVLPEPVSPHTMTTWCAAMASMISCRLPDMGSDSGNSICKRGETGEEIEDIDRNYPG